MPAAFVQRVTATSTSSSALTTPSMNTTNGNIVHVNCTNYNGVSAGAGATITDNGSSNTWEVANAAANPADAWRVQQNYAKNINGRSGHTFTATPTATAFIEIDATEASGVDTTSPLDQNASNVVSGTAQTVTSGVTAQADEIAFGTCGTAGAGSDTMTLDAAYSNIYTSSGVQPTVASGYKVLSAAGAQTFACTTSPSRAGCSQIATFKAAAGGGATRPVKMAGNWGGYAGTSGGFAG